MAFPRLQHSYTVLASSPGLVSVLTDDVVTWIAKAGTAMDFLYVSDADPVGAGFPVTVRLSMTVQKNNFGMLAAGAEATVALVHRLNYVGT